MTKEGTLFLQYAKQLLNVETVALRGIHMLDICQDHLNVACTQRIHDRWFTDDVVRCSRDFPGIAVNMIVDHGEALISMIHTGTLDLAATAYNINTNSLISQFHKKSRVILVGKREQYSCLQEGVQGEDLLNLPSIYSDIWDDHLSDTSEHFLLDERIYCIHCNTLGGAKNFYAAGLGCYLLPAGLAKHELEVKTLVETPVREIFTRYINLHMIYNRARLGSAAMRYFLELFSQMVPK